MVVDVVYSLKEEIYEEEAIPLDYEKENILDLFEASLEKKEWRYVLVTSELFGEEADLITTKEIIGLHREWKEELKGAAGKRGAVYQLNQGNMFMLVHETDQNFEQRIRNTRLYSMKANGGLQSSLLYLTNKESEFLLKMP